MISLSDMGPVERFAIVGRILGLLGKSGFRSRSRWPLAVVVLRGPGEHSHVTSRVDHAAWLRANDLHDAARECLRQSLRPGEVLLWAEVDDADASAVGFETINLTREARALVSALDTESETKEVA